MLRPGRIDKRVKYNLATKKQAWALYRRFFPESHFSGVTLTQESAPLSSQDTPGRSTSESMHVLHRLADQFADAVPEDEFSTAELQGYLLGYKTKPFDAISDLIDWIEQERQDKRKREERENKRKEKRRESLLKAKAAAIAEFVAPLYHQVVANETSPPESSLASDIVSGVATTSSSKADHASLTVDEPDSTKAGQ